MAHRKEHLEKGASVWVRDPDEAWVRGVITEKSGKNAVRVKTSRGNVEAPLDDVEYNSTTARQEEKTRDLTQLPDLHHAALLNTLNVRFDADSIYTFCGTILIAVNPFKRIKGLYEPRAMQKYLNAELGQDMEPHAYTVAGRAYQAMALHSGRNQSILVSGESGAGKTYNTKVLLSYLTVVSSGDPQRGLEEYRSSLSRKPRERTIGANVSQRILEANPLMESFGNAKTLRNDNSSRFGKLIELAFSANSYQLQGALIDVYLLEKARVTHQQEGERNYHIFYELDAGLSKDEKRELHFPKLKDCNYIKSSTFDRADIDDQTQWNITRKGFDVLGFTEEERWQVIRIVIAVLHLGNLKFETADFAGAEGSTLKENSFEAAESAALLLGIEAEELIVALTTRAISVGGMGAGFLAALNGASSKSEELVKRHTVSQAEEARDAFAMALYERTFHWLVWRINESIGVSSKAAKAAKKKAREAMQKTQKRGGRSGDEDSFISDNSIGILDIFGFEVFEKNGFEQLLINYTNEKLQSQFNDHIFKLERALFESEGLNWKVIDWPDNALVLEMIEARPIGLLALLDEACLMPQGSDKTLAPKLTSNLSKGKFNPVFMVDRNSEVRSEFMVAHFAGDVTYTLGDFCVKNKNEVRQEVVDLTRASADPWLAMLLPPDATAAGGGSDAQEYFTQMAGKPRTARSSLQRNRRGSPVSTRLQQKTVSANFRSQLTIALNHVNSSEPHYIRCIKPNDANVDSLFDRPRVEEQLSYSGVLEAIKVTRAGYPTKLLLKDFAQRFHVLSVGKAASSSSSSSRRRSKTRWSKRRLSKRRGGGNGGGSRDWREQCMKILEKADLKNPEDYQIGNTKVFLKAYAYTMLEVMKGERILKHVLVLQRNIRVFLRTYRAMKKTRAVKKIQRNVRGFLVRREYSAFRDERKAAVQIQRIARGMIARGRIIPLIEEKLVADERQREEAAKRIKKAYKRKVMKDRLREIREESLRQRSAIMLQSLARVLKSQKVANDLYAKKITGDAARTLQGVARMIAAKKTREMLEQEQEEEEYEEPNLFAIYAGPLLVLFLFTQPIVMLGVGAMLVAMMAGAGMALEADQRQKLYDEYSAGYSLRAHNRTYDSDLSDLSDEEEDEVDDDVEFFRRHRKKTKEISRKASKVGIKPLPRSRIKGAGSKPGKLPPRPTGKKGSSAKTSLSSSSRSSRKLPPPRKAISSRKLKKNAFNDFENFYGASNAGKKKGAGRVSSRKYRAGLP